MRIISGQNRGQKLLGPKDDRVRPTIDRVKEAVFSSISQVIQDRIVVDLFAGTGSLGLEALSRGAKQCFFVDISKESLALIRHNIQVCDQGVNSIVINEDWQTALAHLDKKAHIFFLDPPYGDSMIVPVIEQIQQLNKLEGDGIIIAEHDIQTPLPDSILNLEKYKEKKYGQVIISLYGFKEKK